jgi:hypothetical protein
MAREVDPVTKLLLDKKLPQGMDHDVFMWFLKRFETLVRADEREACAQVCDELIAPDVYSDTDVSMWDVTCIDCAAAIRARGQA